MPPRSSGAATIRDVARLSGVSIATVTRTFQGSPRVRPETRERVREAATKLGYHPDTVARTLVTGRSNTVGMLVPSLVQAYWGELADAIEHRAGELGYSVMIASSRGDPDRERAMLDVLFGKRLDGVILAGVLSDPDGWPGRNGHRPPLVLVEWDATPKWDVFEALCSAPLTQPAWRLVEEHLPGDWIAHVSYDDVAGATIATQHLLDLGHTEVAFLAGPPVRTCLLRLLGVRSTLERAGHRMHAPEVTADAFEDARTAATKLLRRPSRPSGLVCYSDVIAVGAMRAAHELGLRVPEDLSITGFDDIALAGYIDPPLTTIRNPKRELGELALELLLEPPERHGDRYRRLSGELVVRGSTAAPSVPAELASTTPSRVADRRA